MTLTFVYAELAGFTALTDIRGDDHTAAVATEVMDSARPLIAGQGGEEVKALSDSLLIRFNDAADALHAAKELVCALGRRERPLGLRVGIHTGTAVRRDGDWFEHANNVAVRVAGFAKAGEVLFTAATRSAAASHPEHRPLGPHALKSLATRMELYALVLDDRLPVGRVLDPVCHMSIEAATLGYRLEHDGAQHAFCSSECRQTFIQEPDLYAPR